ncbi:MAG: phage tail sheath family protein [Thermonemataceae bacterium]
MAQKLATPGVYVEEKNAFPSSVVAVSTAVPAFIGYTEKVTSNGQSLVNTPVRISSLSEFINMFGEGFKSNFAIEETTGEGFDFEVDGKTYDVVPENASRFLLYDSIRLFFANGGNVCYIVSAGSIYKKVQVQKSTTGKDDKGKATVEKTTQTENKPAAISKKALEAALQTLVGEQEPTMVVIPEAVMLERQDCAALQQAMLQHCGTELKNRFAILDVYEGHKPRTYDSKDVVTAFREDIGNNFLNFGAAYYPWVRTSVVQSDELDYTNISNADMLIDLLEKEAKERFQDSKKVDEIKNEVKKMKDSSTDVESLHQTLNAISSVYKSVLNSIRKQLNILPPSAGMAGVYTMVDSTRGVWKAPANVGYNSVVTPAVKITNQDQEDLNVTVSGKSVNAIRAFAGEGILVWGARTLEGNSKDWRYVNVRRTISFIEQSIKAAARTYVFEPNAASTWLLIRGMVNAFLSDLWTQGALVGTTPEQAYEVHVGLGSTMTTDDILDGIMRITVKVAVSRPAEFIVITFQQKMEEA